MLLRPKLRILKLSFIKKDEMASILYMMVKVFLTKNYRRFVVVWNSEKGMNFTRQNPSDGEVKPITQSQNQAP